MDILDPIDTLVWQKRPHRAVLAAVAVAPGALLLIWGLIIQEFGAGVGVVLGWFPALGVAGMLGGMIYLLINEVRKGLRTLLATALGVGFNLIYLVVLIARFHF